jgi:SAM-dependent methyltransferase
MKQVNADYKCIVCGGANYTVPFDARGFRVIACNECKFGMVDPVPADEALSELYNSAEYFASHMQYDYDNISQEASNKLITQTGKLHEKYLGKYLKPNASILEIGTGGGFALRYFKNKGYRVKGIETSTSSVKFAKEKLGLDIEQLQFEQYESDAAYDIIMLNHVLEHFTNLNQVMKLLVSKLYKGGILYVRVPNHDSYDRRSFKEKWPAYLPFHISYFSKKSLRKLFGNFNLNVLETDEYISERFLASAPKLLSGGIKKLVHYAGLTQYFNGRTITIIGQLK